MEKKKPLLEFLRQEINEALLQSITRLKEQYRADKRQSLQEIEPKYFDTFWQLRHHFMHIASRNAPYSHIVLFFFGIL